MRTDKRQVCRWGRRVGADGYLGACLAQRRCCSGSRASSEEHVRMIYLCTGGDPGPRSVTGAESICIFPNVESWAFRSLKVVAGRLA